MNNNSLERTLSIIKPDAVERELETKIKKIFLDNKLNIVDSKKIQISKEEAEKFYKVHQTKPFYEKLCSYLSSGPIIAIILDGENAIQKNRDLMGVQILKKQKMVQLENFMEFLLIKIQCMDQTVPKMLKQK